MNISTNYNQSFNIAGLNSIKTKQNQQQEQIKNNQDTNTMYIGKKESQNKQDKRIDELTKRKDEIQKRISELQSGQKLQSQTLEGASNPEAVREKVKELQASIKEIESTIATIKQEKKDEQEAKNSSKSTEKTQQETQEESIISSSKSLDRIKQSHAQQVSMEGQSNILKTEIKIDRGRHIDTTLKEKQLAGINSGIKKLDNNIAKEMKKIHNKSSKNEDSENLKADSDSNKSTDKAEEANYNEKLIQEYSKNTNMVKGENDTSKINIEI